MPKTKNQYKISIKIKADKWVFLCGEWDSKESALKYILSKPYWNRILHKDIIICS